MTLAVDGTVHRSTFEMSAALQCAPGEIVAVLGPNGAGKTTLLRALAGLDPLTSGRIGLGGQVFDEPAAGVFVPPAARGAGVVFADVRLFPHLRALDNVGFGMPATSRAARQAVRNAAHDHLDRLGVGAMAERRPRELSAGQAQRVALARAVARAPSYLLLDEPLGALDAQSRPLVRSWLAAEVARLKAPCLVVTHDSVDALTLGDRLVVLENGRVTQDGSPVEIARRPATDYVARLVGLNFYVGELTGNRLQVDGGGELVCADRAGSGRAQATVRPSAVTLYVEPPSHTSARNLWHGRIASVDPMGERCRVGIVSRPPIVAEITTPALAELRVGVGDEVWASVKATDVTVSPR